VILASWLGAGNEFDRSITAISGGTPTRTTTTNQAFVPPAAPAAPIAEGI
jgi:hypothetical protein